jgi:hypothetical protein
MTPAANPTIASISRAKEEHWQRAQHGKQVCTHRGGQRLDNRVRTCEKLDH